MKGWKTVVLVAGILLLLASFLAYLSRVTSCYPAAGVWMKFTSEYMRSFREACHLADPLQVQFSLFLWLFVPGIILFTAYWLIVQPRVKIHRSALSESFHLLIMLDSLLVMIFSMMSYPAPGRKNSPAAWVIEVVAGLGFLSYLSTLALWHRKRWGLLLLQGTAIVLAVFALLGGGSLILIGFLILGVVVLSLLLRPVRHQLD